MMLVIILQMRLQHRLVVRTDLPKKSRLSGVRVTPMIVRWLKISLIFLEFYILGTPGTKLQLLLHHRSICKLPLIQLLLILSMMRWRRILALWRRIPLLLRVINLWGLSAMRYMTIRITHLEN